jgi:hypothetical protein
VTGLQNALAEAQKKKEKATSDEDRLSAAALFEAARAKIKAVSGKPHVVVGRNLIFLNPVPPP